MKVAAILSLALANGQTTDANRKFKHLEKVYPQMLDLFFKTGGHNAKVSLAFSEYGLTYSVQNSK